MAECLGLYIESNMLKYAKISKERNNIKIESYGVKQYEMLEDVLNQIISETYSFKTPISINLSDEMYNYFNVFSMLSKKDIEKAIKTEFEFYCDENGINKNVIDSRYFCVPNKDDDEKKNAIYLANELRMSGFVVETEYTNRSLKSQFKRADYFNSKYLILLNSDDLNEGLITIKNNKTKEEEKIMMEYIIYYFDEHISDDNLPIDEECTCHDHNHDE